MIAAHRASASPHSSLPREAGTRPDFLRPGARRAVWIWSVLLTVAVAAWFVLTVDAPAVRGALAGVAGTTLLVAMACLVVNAILDAAWLHLVRGAGVGASGPFRVIAWHMLASSVLPARLGDLAWIWFIHRWLRLTPGRATFVALYHRLQDLVVLSVLLLASAVAAGLDAPGAGVAALAAVVLVVLAAVVAGLGRLLTLAALALRALHRPARRRHLHALYRQALQVRIWYRHSLTRAQIGATFAVILARWLAILAGLALLIRVMAGGLAWDDAVFLTNAYVYMGIVPVQALGGFGAGEAGLAWLLTLHGLGIASASAIGLLIRVLLNLVHVGIWLATVSVLALAGAARAPGRRVTAS